MDQQKQGKEVLSLQRQGLQWDVGRRILRAAHLKHYRVFTHLHICHICGWRGGMREQAIAVMAAASAAGGTAVDWVRDQMQNSACKAA
jgi:hypothetical protein